MKKVKFVGLGLALCLALSLGIVLIDNTQNKERGKREIDAEQYNAQSREVMEQLDELFKQRDELIAEQSDGALSKSQYKMLTDFLKNERKQTEFDKDVFTKLVEKVIVNSREDICFVFKDGTEVKAGCTIAI